MSPGVPRIFIGLGSNLAGDKAHPIEQLRAALRAMADDPDIEVRRCSPFYVTAPVQAQGADFINAVAEIRSALDPQELLRRLQAIEAAQHRERPYRNAPRTLDLDLLLWGQERIDSADLTVPHPRMHQRAFVLAPLADLAPDLSIPGAGPVSECLTACEDLSICRLDPG